MIMTVRWPAQQHTVWSQQALDALVGRIIALRMNGEHYPAIVREAVATDLGGLDLTFEVADPSFNPAVGEGGIDFIGLDPEVGDG